jgi:hypothetical protein
MAKFKLILISALCCLIMVSCGDKKPQENAEQVPEPAKQEQTITETQPVVQDTTPAPAVSESKPKAAVKEKAPAKEQQVTTGAKTKVAAEVAKPVDEQFSNPRKFISVSDVSFASRGLTSSNIDLNFTVSNKASKATYKDVVFKVEYYDDEANLLTSKNINCGELIAPGTQTLSKLAEKVKGTETIKMKYVSAKVN